VRAGADFLATVGRNTSIQTASNLALRSSAGTVLQASGPFDLIGGGVVTVQAQSNMALTASSNVAVRAGADFLATVGRNTSIQTASNLALRSSAGTTLQASGPLDLKGSTILLNGGTKPLATVGSQVQVVPGSSTGQIVTGSPTVLGN
jgi:hypothetical protein